MLTFRFYTQNYEILNLRGIKRNKRRWLYGGYFSNTDEEGLEHYYLKFVEETGLITY
jgi:hypothetical protein